MPKFAIYACSAVPMESFAVLTLRLKPRSLNVLNSPEHCTANSGLSVKGSARDLPAGIWGSPET